jgi:hypothetical protein
MSGGTISGNTAYDGNGGGVAVADNNTAEFYLSGTGEVKDNSTGGTGTGKNLFKDTNGVAKYGTSGSPGADIFGAGITKTSTNPLTASSGTISSND